MATVVLNCGHELKNKEISVELIISSVCRLLVFEQSSTVMLTVQTVYNDGVVSPAATIASLSLSAVAKVRANERAFLGAMR
jgi:hypothetical protein